MSAEYFLEVAKYAGAATVILGAVYGLFRSLSRLVRWARSLMRSIRRGLDALGQIDGLVDAVEDIRHQLKVAEAENRALSDSDPSVARFTCGISGQNEYVNATYARWLEVSRSDLIGWRWLSFVPEAERDRLREEWEAARAERRVYRVRHAMQSASGRMFYVDTVVTPVPEDGPVHRWIGVMRRVEPLKD